MRNFKLGRVTSSHFERSGPPHSSSCRTAIGRILCQRTLASIHWLGRGGRRNVENRDFFKNQNLAFWLGKFSSMGREWSLWCHNEAHEVLFQKSLSLPRHSNPLASSGPRREISHFLARKMKSGEDIFWVHTKAAYPPGLEVPQLPTLTVEFLRVQFCFGHLAL